MVVVYYFLIRISGLFELWSENEPSFNLTLLGCDLEDNADLMAENEGEHIAFNTDQQQQNAFQYVTCLHLEHFNSNLTNSELYAKPKNKIMFARYNLLGSKLRKVLENLPAIATAVSETTIQTPQIRVLVKVVEAKQIVKGW